MSAAATTSPTAGAAAGAAGNKRRRDDNLTYAVGEIPTPVASLLAGSIVLHTGVERAVHDTLADAVSTLPFTAEEVMHLLGPVAATTDTTPPFPLDTVDPRTLLLAPMFPPLRELSVRDAVRAWIVVDFLCLPAPARRLEDDLVQRYVEDPSAVADWRAAFTVNGCPAWNSLWQLVGQKYSALLCRRSESDIIIPSQFGLAPKALIAKERTTRQRVACVALLDGIAAKKLGAMGDALASRLIAAVSHSDRVIALAAFKALESLGRRPLYLVGYTLALPRFLEDGEVVKRVCAVLAECNDSQLTAAEPGLVSHVIPALVSALSLHRDNIDAMKSALQALCRVLSSSPYLENTVVTAGAQPLLVAVLSTHCRDADVAFAALSAMEATTSTEANAASLLAAGGLAAIVAACELHTYGYGSGIPGMFITLVARHCAFGNNSLSFVAADSSLPPLISKILGSFIDCGLESDVTSALECTSLMLQCSDAAKTAFVDAGIIDRLMEIQGDASLSDNDDVMCACCVALRVLAERPLNHRGVIVTEAIPSLIHLLMRGSDRAVTEACGALKEFAQSSGGRSAIVKGGGVASFVYVLTKCAGGRVSSASPVSSAAEAALLAILPGVHVNSKARVVAMLGGLAGLLTPAAAGAGVEAVEAAGEAAAAVTDGRVEMSAAPPS